MKSNGASKSGHVLILLLVLTLLLLCTLLYHTESALPSQQPSITDEYRFHGWRTKMVRVIHSISPPTKHAYRYSSPPPPHISHASPPRIPNVPRTPPSMPHAPQQPPSN